MTKQLTKPKDDSPAEVRNNGLPPDVGGSIIGIDYD